MSKLTERPECFEFAMEFLGDPEASAVREYVEGLEREHEAAAQVLADAAAQDAEMQRLRERVAELERDAALVEAKAAQLEREACAQACDQHARDHHEMGKGPKAAASRLCAAAIRARGAAPQTQCRCTFAQRMQGDGCDVCNPDAAPQPAGDTGVQP